MTTAQKITSLYQSASLGQSGTGSSQQRRAGNGASHSGKGSFKEILKKEIERRR